MSSIHRFRYYLQLWHLLPLALLALLGVSIFVWLGRGQFAQQSVAVALDGPLQMEGGSTEEFSVLLRNGSSVALEDVHIVIDLPGELATLQGGRSLSFDVEEVGSGDTHEERFKVVAISSQIQTSISARADYSPRDLHARFITRATHALTIGSLDANVELELPEAMYPGEEVEGLIRVEPNISLTQTLLYARLVAPEGFDLIQADPAFSNEGERIWKLGALPARSVQEVHFRGRWNSAEDLVVEAHVGRYEGLRFLPLRVERTRVRVSASPLLITIGPLPVSNSQRENHDVPFEVTLNATSEEALRDIEVLVESSVGDAVLSAPNSVASPPGPSLRFSADSHSALQEAAPGTKISLPFVLNFSDVAIEQASSVRLRVEATYEGASGKEATSTTEYEFSLQDLITNIEEE